MKQRRGRRGFWWWSWLLALITIGMTVGGFYYGKKRWENVPKDYVAEALLSVDIREPFARTGATEIATGLLNTSETEVLRSIESNDDLVAIINDLELSKRWEISRDEAVVELKSSLDLDLDRKEKELTVKLTRHAPEEAAEIANAIARTIPERIRSLDEKKIGEAEMKLQEEIVPLQEAAEEARLEVKKALAEINAPLDPVPGMDLSTYLQVPAVAAANLDWEAAMVYLNDYMTSVDGKREFSKYLAKTIKPSVMISPAVPPTRISGPELRPFQMQTALYGLTSGLLAGVLMMALCWKLFK